LGGLLALCCATASLAAGSVRAQVIEIGDDGVVRQRSNTAIVGWTTVSSVPAAVPRQAMVHAAAPASVPAMWRAPLEAAAGRNNVSPHLLAALIWQESRWQPQAVSPKGAIGLGQLMPATARALAVDPRDPQTNLDGAARYLRLMLDMFDGDVVRALAAYNAGAARVVRAGGVPPIAETRSYVASILDRVSATTTPGPTLRGLITTGLPK
jgi:soluble lytic murein transglycosylase-like protein